MLENSHFHVELLDWLVATKNEFVEKAKKADIIGFSAPTVLANTVLKLAKYVKKLSKDKIVVVGGPHATICPDFFLKSGYVDFVVRGEGEYTFLELVEKISSDTKDVPKVLGISYMEEGKIIHNPDRPLIKNLDKLPIPARHLLPMERYFALQKKLYGYKKLTVLTTRGCPYRCIFCAKEIFGRFYRRRSVENCVNEIELLINKYGVKKILFIDDTFTLDRNFIIELCNEIRRRNLKVRWSCEGRVNHIDYELLKIMKNAGCDLISYGVESGSQKVLNYLNKDITVEQIVRASHLTKRAGIIVKFYLIVGTPTERWEDILLTKKLIIQTKPDLVDITTFVPMPGTKSLELIKNKLLPDFEKPENVNYRKESLFFQHDFFTNEDIRKIKSDIRRMQRIFLIFTAFSPHKVLYFLQNFREVLSFISMVAYEELSFI
jgi:radical SAM superfamily enzyme YgiQ (UPF0313 family)